MTTLFNILAVLFGASPKNISIDMQEQIRKADCDDPFTSGTYCYSERPFISNFTNN